MNNASERRLAENELLFRSHNQKVQRQIDADFMNDRSGSLQLQFYCECSNLQCRQRISLTADEYRKLHKNSKQFIAIDGHEIPEIEKVVAKKDGFNIIEKFIDPLKAISAT